MIGTFYIFILNILLISISYLIAQTCKLIKSFKYSTDTTQLLYFYALQQHDSSSINSWGAYFGVRQFTFNVTTPWNSTFDMFYNLVCMQKPLAAMQAKEGSKPDSKHPFLSDQWREIIYTILGFLQPFQDVTEDLSDQEYPTLRYSFVTFQGLNHNCQYVFEQHSSSSTKNLVMLLKAGLEERFQKVQKTNEKLANMSIVVDP